MLRSVISRSLRVAARTPDALTSARIARRYRTHTMLLRGQFIDNLMLAARYTPPVGDVVECGVWRGGMIRGLADILGPARTYHLFDSFEGLPPAGEIDGQAAIAWQADTRSPDYHENCAAEESYARSLFNDSGLNYSINRGWFEDVLPEFKTENQIALLRLDGDWYDSTMTCLVNLIPQLAPRALILIDDYHTWDGCARAVHDYLSQTKSTMRIRQSALGTCYLINGA